MFGNGGSTVFWRRISAFMHLTTSQPPHPPLLQTCLCPCRWTECYSCTCSPLPQTLFCSSPLSSPEYSDVDEELKQPGDEYLPLGPSFQEHVACFAKWAYICHRSTNSTSVDCISSQLQRSWYWIFSLSQATYIHRWSPESKARGRAIDQTTWVSLSSPPYMCLELLLSLSPQGSSDD